jgi:hypothetical protein
MIGDMGSMYSRQGDAEGALISYECNLILYTDLWKRKMKRELT